MMGEEGVGGARPEEHLEPLGGGGESIGLSEQRSRSLPATRRKDCIPTTEAEFKKACVVEEGLYRSSDI